MQHGSSGPDFTSLRLIKTGQEFDPVPYMFQPDSPDFMPSDDLHTAHDASVASLTSTFKDMMKKEKKNSVSEPDTAKKVSFNLGRG